MMEKLFLDTNIVLDLIGNREPFVKEAAFLFQLGRNKECQLFVSDLTFVNIAYITRKTYPKEKLYSVLSKITFFSYDCWWRSCCCRSCTCVAG